MFADLSRVSKANGTFISLVPKVDRPDNFSQFQLINLCNIVYKVVTKLVVTKVKEVMGKLVSPSRSSFILGRQTTDNILIAQEVVHSMRLKKGRIGFMAIKIDLEKAYDRLKWPFIVDTLKDTGDNIIEVVQQCISSSSMNFLWDRGQFSQSQPMRGICQGDPFLPIFLSSVLNV